MPPKTSNKLRKRVSTTTHSDRTLGIRTRGKLDVSALALEGPNAVHAERYEPTPEGILEDMLLEFTVDGMTFTDLGCGRGAVVCRAALLPFQRVLGIELSRRLVHDARANLDAVRKTGLVKAGEVEILHADAAFHRFEHGPRLVYLYNPFRPPVLRAVLANLIARQARDRLATHVLYFEPKHAHVLTDRREIRLVREQPRWAVYSVDAHRPG